MSVTRATPILSPAAWRGEDLRRTTDWTRPITDADVEELDAALQRVKSRSLDWRAMTRDDF